ncbi:MAG: hypothetical protein M1814_006878 [Vezdaea aestivalis]|nr:MAG: hypothetical protein M1814_006878 [Vezdaea aestivalis]
MASHCHDENSGHGGHSHTEHDHTDDLTPAIQSHLYQEIEFDNITTFNETLADSGRKIVQKTWQQRMDPTPELESDADEQLLIHVPFTGQVKLHCILIRTSDSSASPRTVQVHINRDDIDFSLATELQPIQSIEISQTSDLQEIPLKRVLFNSTRSVTLFIESNWGDGEEETTRLSYIGFKGDYMKLNKEPVNFLYEAAAQPGDHKPIVGISSLSENGLGGPSGSRSGH